MTTDELIKALERMESETGSLADSLCCLGCGHEHNCGMYGCAVIREAIDRISIAEWIPDTLELPPDDREIFVLTRSKNGSHFYPRPPGGGRQQKRTKFSSVFAQKGEEFASLRRGKRKICRWRFKKDKFWVLIWCEGSGKSVCASASHCG